MNGDDRMITRKLKIRDIEDETLVKDKCRNYSYALRNVFNNLELSRDGGYVADIKAKHGLTDIEYRSVLSAAEAIRKANEERKADAMRRIVEMEERLATDKKLSKRDKYKLYNKVARLKKTVDGSVVFGGRALLASITRECNKGADKDNERLSRLKADYRKKKERHGVQHHGRGQPKGKPIL